MYVYVCICECVRVCIYVCVRVCVFVIVCVRVQVSGVSRIFQTEGANFQGGRKPII